MPKSRRRAFNHPMLLATILCGPSAMPSMAAQTPHPVASFEEALTRARSLVPGSLKSIAFECPDATECAYVIQVEDEHKALVTVKLQAIQPSSQGIVASAVVKPETPSTRPRMAELGHSGVYANLSAFVTFGAGQTAGLGNVILNPLVQPGLSGQFTFSEFPQWEADAMVRLIYGKTEYTDPATLAPASSKAGVQEYRGQGHIFYNFHKDGDAAKAGVGLYWDMARSAKSMPRYRPQTTDSVYAAEEGEISSNIFDTGVDVRFSLREQRMASEMHNIIFLSGNRIAPNLLTYKPMLAFMWSNQFAITGTMDHPGWSLNTGVDFYFARKAGVRYFNSHDGLGGTKREIDLSYGLSYNFSDDQKLSVMSYGFNNLNRGNSAMVPVGFKDGLSVTYSQKLN